MKLSADEIKSQLVRVSGWELHGEEIKRVFTFKDFGEALTFVNQVAEEAEKMDHHPDISIHYNVVELSLSTHSEGGLTEKDFRLAASINQLT